MIARITPIFAASIKKMKIEINQFSLCEVKTIIHPIILYYYEEIIYRTTD